MKVFSCKALGQCTLEKRAGGVPCCIGCKSRELAHLGPSQAILSGPGANEGHSRAVEPGGQGPDTLAETAKMTVTPRKPHRPIRWAYGVTTVPARRYDLLPRTLESMKRAGFDNPRLFVDGVDDTSPDYSQFGLKVTRRDLIRLAGNWVLGIYELYYRDPNCDRYALFQDDLVASKNLREYLDHCDYPQRGYWNLYTFTSNLGKCPKDEKGQMVEGWYEAYQNGRGALGLVFDRNALVTLLSSRYLATRPQDPRRGWKVIDGGIVEAMKPEGYKEHTHYPSLLQHTGIVSQVDKRKTVIEHDPKFPHHQWPEEHLATSFRGEDFDCLSLLKEK